MFTPSEDLTAIQSMLNSDSTILSLLDLIGKEQVEINKKIIKRSKWDDLATNEKRLCLYFIPSRPTRCQDLHEQIIEIVCHAPSSLDYVATDVIGRAATLLNKKQIQGRLLKVTGQLGELPTMTGFYSCGIRICYYDPI